MLFGKTHKECEEWRKVFALLPVVLNDGRIAWLCVVETRLVAKGFSINAQYRLPE
jgi:hypothetical protein